MFAVQIGLATATVGQDAGQLLNMVFGNTSLHDDVVLHDIALPKALINVFGGPRHGIAELRFRLKLHARALTASALKPQGLPADALALLAERLARGGLDFIKDDHGLADQGLFQVRRADCRLRGRGRPRRTLQRSSDTVCAQPDGKPGSTAGTGNLGAGGRAGLFDAGADDLWLPDDAGDGA